jgi:hypothetical protein
MGHQTTAAEALSEAWLARTDETLAYYRKVRDKHVPGKPFWNTETADAACGGNPWGGQFLDTFRYLDQLGRLAKQEVEVVMHNTLVASDYGMLDDRDFTLRDPLVCSRRRDQQGLKSTTTSSMRERIRHVGE